MKPSFHIGLARSPEDIDAARALLSEYVAGLGVNLSFQGFPDEAADLPAAYAPPAGDMLLAHGSAGAVACMGFRPHKDRICELKRLYVRAEARGVGLGRRMMEQAMLVARSRGYRVARLDTLPGMGAAHRLYVSMGFREIPPYYDNPIVGTRYFERDL